MDNSCQASGAAAADQNLSIVLSGLLLSWAVEECVMRDDDFDDRLVDRGLGTNLRIVNPKQLSLKHDI